MKLDYKNFQKGKYYCCDIKDSETKLYFKYSFYDTMYINYYYSFHKFNDGYNTYIEEDSLSIEWYKKYCTSSREVFLKEFVDYLPERNLDKKFYFRKKKIKSLINENPIK